MLFEQSTHELALDQLHFNTAVYTRSPVVEALLDRLEWPSCGGNLLDPAAGDGAFLVAALRRLEPAAGDLMEAQRVHGWEIHPAAVAEARRRVSECLVSLGWAASAADKAARLIVECADYLTVADTRPWRTIAGNPPYLRWGHLPEFFQDIYHPILPAYARPDLLFAFLDKCSLHLGPDGRMGFVTSDRWLANESCIALRRELGTRVRLDHVERIDCSSAFYRPKVRRSGTPPRIHPVLVVLSSATNCAGALSSGAPISADTGKAIFGNAGPTLGDVCGVWLGPWLGPKGVFVLPREQAALLPGAVLVDVLDGKDIGPDVTVYKGPTRSVAIFTDADVVPSPAVMDHLQRTMHLMPPRGRKRAGISSAWLPPELIKSVPSQTALMVPRIATHLRPITIPAGTLPINHALTVIEPPREPSALKLLVEYLSGPIARAWVAEHAQRLENGYLSIQTTLLRRLPVPIEIAALAGGREQSSFAA